MHSDTSLILIVDDDAVTRALIKGVLEKAGCQTIEASNGKEAIKQHKEQKPDVVITDILMPEKEGLETIMELKKVDPDVRIIAMSGGGNVRSEGYLTVARTVGAEHTIEKPINMDDLIEKVKSLLPSQ